MTKDVSNLNIQIMDKEYRIACPADEQDSLRASAEFLNAKLNEIRSRGSVIGAERIAIMAALNLAHELLNSQGITETYNDVDARVGNLQKKIDIALREIEVT
ncbi:MAG: cell division protein ZapA [Gammaproteobacteria bacterium]|nr:cell division protein ZapA [Gammaproteobacteria bacterium]